MPRYRITQYQTFLKVYEVEADDRGKAVAAVVDDIDALGLGEAPKFLENNIDIGLSMDELADAGNLLDELQAAEVDLQEWGLPSIARIEEVDA